MTMRMSTFDEKHDSDNKKQGSLKIRFGHFDDDIHDPDELFKLFDYKEWFRDPFVIEMVETIDKCKFNGTSFTGDFGVFGFEELSSGSKALVLMYKHPEFVYDATRCGNNCAKWIVEVAKRVDLTISLRYDMRFHEDGANFLGDFYCINTEEMLHGDKDFDKVFYKWEHEKFNLAKERGYGTDCD